MDAAIFIGAILIIGIIFAFANKMWVLGGFLCFLLLLGILGVAYMGVFISQFK